VYLDLFIDKRT